MSKRRLVISVSILLICLFASPVRSQYYESYMSLYADEERTSYQVFTSGPGQLVDFYVFLHPGSDGAFGVEYKLIGPEGHFLISYIANPFVSLHFGSPFDYPGVSVAFIKCRTEILWVFHVTIFASTVDPGFYDIVPHDYYEFLGVAICPDPRPLRDAYVLNRLRFNQPVATEETSWGAIKGIYGDGNR